MTQHLSPHAADGGRSTTPDPVQDLTRSRLTVLDAECRSLQRELAAAEELRDAALSRCDALETRRRELEQTIAIATETVSPIPIPADCALVAADIEVIDASTGEVRICTPGMLLASPRASLMRVATEISMPVIPVTARTFEDAIRTRKARCP